MAKGKLIIVSYRLPFRLTIVRAKLIAVASVGGLATALRSYFEIGAKSQFESLCWVGVSDISKKAFDKASSTVTLEKDNIIMNPVFLTSRMKEEFYDGFCNSVLWPLFLYFPSFVVYKEAYFREYVEVNEIMCRKILEVYEPGDTIWIHDYHWMLLPTFLRKEFPHAKIGFFLHIPFPSFELFRLLPKPWRTRIIMGLIGADVIGFQTDEYSTHFIDSLNQILPVTTKVDEAFVVNDRPSLIKTFPISIDFQKFSLTCKMPETCKNVKRIRGRLAVGKLILSVDRLDYTKAIFNRLEAFELFLEQNAEFRERVSYLLLMVPTRESILKYRENKLNVEGLISRINGKYSTLGWTPIVYQYQSVDYKRLISLYAAADIALVVPSLDGMNLVAKEYVASRSNGDGVLVLSETAGAASELRQAVLVNANDRQEIADAILMGILMPKDEQKARIEKMQDHIRRNDVMTWATDFLHSIDEVINHVELEV